MIIFELPPQPKGSTEEQLRELRQYLIRLVNQLNEASREQERIRGKTND